MYGDLLCLAVWCNYLGSKTWQLLEPQYQWVNWEELRKHTVSNRVPAYGKRLVRLLVNLASSSRIWFVREFKLKETSYLSSHPFCSETHHNRTSPQLPQLLELRRDQFCSDWSSSAVGNWSPKPSLMYVQVLLSLLLAAMSVPRVKDILAPSAHSVSCFESWTSLDKFGYFIFNCLEQVFPLPWPWLLSKAEGCRRGSRGENPAVWVTQLSRGCLCPHSQIYTFCWTQRLTGCVGEWATFATFGFAVGWAHLFLEVCSQVLEGFRALLSVPSFSPHKGERHQKLDLLMSNVLY